MYGEKRSEPADAPQPPKASVQRIPVYTTLDAPVGYRVERTIGLCWGVAVRSRDIVNSAVAGLRTIGGGEIPELVHLAEITRAEALKRLEEHAAEMGANAVVGARFDSTSIAPANEIFAYGTAVVVVPVTD
jgi:uncharacterized protein YbjQ (UPF0145 family)